MRSRLFRGIIARTKSLLNSLLSLDSDSLRAEFLSKLVSVIVSTRPSRVVNLSCGALRGLLEISSSNLTLGDRVSTLMVVLTGAHSLFNRVLALHSNGHRLRLAQVNVVSARTTLRMGR